MIRDPRTRDDLLGAPGERRPIGGGDGGAVFEDLRDPEFVIKIFHGPRASGIDGVDGIDFIRAAVEHEAEMFNRFYGACSAEAFFTRDDYLCLRMRRVPGKPMNKVWPSEYGESKREILEALDTMQAQLVEVGVTHGDLHSANVHFDAQARRFWPVDLGAASAFALSRMGPDAPTPGPLASDDSHMVSLQARVSALMDSHVPEVDEVHAPLFELVHWQSCVRMAARCGEVFADPADATYVYKLLFSFSFTDFAPGVDTGPRELQRAVNELRHFERYYGSGTARLIRTSNGCYLLRMRRVPGVPVSGLAAIPDDYPAAWAAMMRRLGAAGMAHPDLRPDHLIYDATTQLLNPVSFASCRLAATPGSSGGREHEA